jgi:hypothetical protein
MPRGPDARGGSTPRFEGGPQDDAYEDDVPYDAPRVRLGDWLREARLRKGLSFADIERDTRINRHYLEALEAEHFEVLPAPVYARGFLRSYARALGLDPQTAMALMPEDLPQPAGLEPLPGMRRSGGDAPAFSMPSIPLPSLTLIRSQWLMLGTGALLLLAAGWLVLAAATGGDGDPEGATGATGANVGLVATVPPFEQGRAPNFVGVPREVAQAKLQELGMEYVAIEIDNQAPRGTVVGQTPSAGSQLDGGDSVTLVVSRGP